MRKILALLLIFSIVAIAGCIADNNSTTTTQADYEIIAYGPALQKGCGIWKSHGCPSLTSESDFTIEGYGITISDACDNVLGSPVISDSGACYDYCCGQ